MNWHKQIKSVVIENYIDNNNIAILKEERQKYGMLYNPRIFCYSRKCFKLNNKFYIVDESVD